MSPRVTDLPVSWEKIGDDGDATSAAKFRGLTKPSVAAPCLHTGVSTCSGGGGGGGRGSTIHYYVHQKEEAATKFLTLDK